MTNGGPDRIDANALGIHGHRRLMRAALVVVGIWNLLVLILLLVILVERSTSGIDSAFKSLALLGVLDAFVWGNAFLLAIGTVAWLVIRRGDRRRVFGRALRVRSGEREIGTARMHSSARKCDTFPVVRGS